MGKLYRRIPSLKTACFPPPLQLGGNRSKNIQLEVGVTKVEVEVVAEDGTVKIYCVKITRLSAKVAELSNLALEGDLPLDREFSSRILEYNSERHTGTQCVIIILTGEINS